MNIGTRLPNFGESSHLPSCVTYHYHSSGKPHASLRETGFSNEGAIRLRFSTNAHTVGPFGEPSVASFLHGLALQTQACHIQGIFPISQHEI